MIRYVVAVLLTTALLGLGFAAIGEVSVVRGETQVDGEIATIESAAVSLLTNDDPVPADKNPPRRVVDIDLPTDGFASASVETLRFEPVPETDRTVVRYQFEGASESTVRIDAPLVNSAPETDALDLSGSTGTQTVVLELTLDGADTPVIEVTVR